jgi:very-short-patch-repair endonuclease
MYTYTKQLKNFARANRKAGNLSEALLWYELKQRKMGGAIQKTKTYWALYR